MNARQAAAMRFASAGWPVFPCQPGRKEPATIHGVNDATTDPRVITRWWQTWPDANVAIATGTPGPDVLDVDNKPDGNGFEAFNRIKRAGLLTGAKAIVRTPARGLHVYFDGTGQRNGRIRAAFIDFRGKGGYVLAPPSEVGGHPYEVIDKRSSTGTLDWSAVRYLLDPPKPPGRLPPSRAGDGTRLVAWVAQLHEGNRNDGLFWAACRAIETGSDVLDDLVAAAVQAGLDERGARDTILSARRRVAS